MPKNKDFQVGDVVRIRDYEDMKSEFGLVDDGSGVINCSGLFTPKMRELCGRTFTISYISNRGRVSGHSSGWSISTDMLELAYDEIVQSEELSDYLSSMSIIGG